MENNLIEKFIRDSKNDDLVNIESISRIRFEAYLEALKSKLIISKGERAKEQLNDIEWMLRNLDRQKYFICNHSFQAKMINELSSQVLKLENEKMELIERYEEELKQVKKRIKNDKESK